MGEASERTDTCKWCSHKRLMDESDYCYFYCNNMASDSYMMPVGKEDTCGMFLPSRKLRELMRGEGGRCKK